MMNEYYTLALYINHVGGYPQSNTHQSVSANACRSTCMTFLGIFHLIVGGGVSIFHNNLLFLCSTKQTVHSESFQSKETQSMERK